MMFGRFAVFFFFFFCRCKHLSAEWEELEEACNKRAAHLSKAITREQVRVLRDFIII